MKSYMNLKNRNHERDLSLPLCPKCKKKKCECM